MEFSPLDNSRWKVVRRYNREGRIIPDMAPKKLREMPKKRSYLVNIFISFL